MSDGKIINQIEKKKKHNILYILQDSGNTESRSQTYTASFKQTYSKLSVHLWAGYSITFLHYI